MREVAAKYFRYRRGEKQQGGFEHWFSFSTFWQWYVQRRVAFNAKVMLLWQ